MVALAQARVRMSVQEFLKWDSGDGRRWQLIDGEPRAMAPAKTRHSRLQAEVARRIGNHLLAGDLPCDVFTAPGVIPATMAALNMRVPDVAVSCSPTDNQAALPNPVLIVEILSPGNAADTWRNVWAYTSIPSVREILVLWTETPGAELLRRGDDGAWPDQPAVVTEGDLVLDSIGLTVALAELYARTGVARG